ncbi:DUF4148 domain-containing protein [Corticibacter populi]|uniref:DUF4148 domain-containing protein n=1 Tax=Corticibacter populi TaxID=1550736 RepID=A0A3M6QNY4_9BURK|nr:DUF4148 domain-containing protein [Corticibacter populi]RMX04780.1 DUF4148 domain-containing protein [Corticibacter populi]RZS33808.1 hypothetical protein EV687_2135 [Corticibacter populi]
MKKIARIISMAAIAAAAASAAHAAAYGDDSVGDFDRQALSTHDRAEVQKEARAAIAQHAFRDDVTADFDRQQAGSQLSRERVHAQAVEAVRQHRIDTGS